MEEPLINRYFPTIMKIIRYRCGPFKDFWCYLIYSILIFFTLTTTACLDISKRGMEVLQELLALIVCLAADTIFLSRNIDEIVEVVMQPLISSGENAAHSKIAKAYKSRQDKYTKLVAASFLGGFYLWLVVVSVAIFLEDDHYDQPCTRLTLGWIWRSRFDRYFAILCFVWSLIRIHFGMLFTIISIMAVIKIKAQVELLCSDLNSLNDILKEPYQEQVGSGFTNALQCLQVGFGPGDVFNFHQEEVYKNSDQSKVEPISTENQKHNTEHHLPRMNEKIIEQNVNRVLKNLVEQHIRIIKLVAMTDKLYRKSYMVIIQVTIILLALVIPKINFDTKDAPRVENVEDMIKIPGIIILLSTFNYVGQQFINESEKLREAVYGCDWTDKPRSLRRGILIMQIVASRPLRLTLGGIYTLSMETFINIASATYSYASLKQSIG